MVFGGIPPHVRINENGVYIDARTGNEVTDVDDWAAIANALRFYLAEALAGWERVIYDRYVKGRDRDFKDWYPVERARIGELQKLVKP